MKTQSRCFAVARQASTSGLLEEYLQPSGDLEIFYADVAENWFPRLHAGTRIGLRFLVFHSRREFPVSSWEW